MYDENPFAGANGFSLWANSQANPVNLPHYLSFPIPMVDTLQMRGLLAHPFLPRLEAMPLIKGAGFAVFRVNRQGQLRAFFFTGFQQTASYPLPLIVWGHKQSPYPFFIQQGQETHQTP